MEKLVGIENRTSKQGNNYKIIHTEEPFRNQNHGKGIRTKSQYISLKTFEAAEVEVGDFIEISYGVGQDSKAYIKAIYKTSDEQPL